MSSRIVTACKVTLSLKPLPDLADDLLVHSRLSHESVQDVIVTSKL